MRLFHDLTTPATKPSRQTYIVQSKTRPQTTENSIFEAVSEMDQVRTHYMYGALFENMVVAEVCKYLSYTGSKQALFWRNNKKQEIDLLVERSPAELDAAIEIKASRSPKRTHFATLDRVGKELGLEADRRFVVYDGSERMRLREHGTFVPWSQFIENIGFAD